MAGFQCHSRRGRRFSAGSATPIAPMGSPFHTSLVKGLQQFIPPAFLSEGRKGRRTAFGESVPLLLPSRTLHWNAGNGGDEDLQNDI